jgi:hypothetical protein
MERRVAIGGGVDLIVRERQRLREQVANARFVVDDEHVVGATAARCRHRYLRRYRLRHLRPLRIEPRVDIALAESPLTSNAYSGNLSGLNQAIHGAEVHLEILQDLFRCQKHFVGGQMQGQGARFYPNRREVNNLRRMMKRPAVRRGPPS